MNSGQPLRLVVVSGRSGSGKTTALHVLEDMGYTCIDNLPANLIPGLFEQIRQNPGGNASNIAIGIDARNMLGDLQHFPEILNQLNNEGISSEVLFLDSRSPVLIRRYSETRRKHPLSSDKIDLKQAVEMERDLLEPIALIASRRIDTSNMTLHQLRDLIKNHIAPESPHETAVQFLSFGFKHGVPVDADFVFDVRCLPNPYWKPEIRAYNGQEQPVIDFLESEPDVAVMLGDLIEFIGRWLPRFMASNRSYISIAIGCTGGQHRSVYIANQLAEHFRRQYPNIQLRHRELDSAWPVHHREQSA